MADLKEVKRCGLISLNANEISLLIVALKLAHESCGLEGKKPVTCDGLGQDLVDAWIKITGEPWID